MPVRVWRRLVPRGEDAPHHVLVDGNAKGQRDLLGNPWTPPGGIPPLHVDDGGHRCLARTLRCRLRRRLRREEPPILPPGQCSMEIHERRRLEDDRGTDQPARAHEERTEARDDAIEDKQAGRPLSGTVENEQLVLDEHGFGDHGTDAARPHESGRLSPADAPTEWRDRAWRNHATHEFPRNASDFSNSPCTRSA